MSLTPDADGTHARIFESSQLDGCEYGTYYICYLFSPSHSWGGYFCMDSCQLFTWHNPTAPHLFAHSSSSYLLPLGSFWYWRFCGTQGWKIYSFSNHSLSQDAIAHSASPSTVSKDQFISQLSNDLPVLPPSLSYTLGEL